VEQQIARGLLDERPVPVEEHGIDAGDVVHLPELPAQQRTERPGAVGEGIGADGAETPKHHKAVLADPSGQQSRGEVGDVLAGSGRDEQPEGDSSARTGMRRS
jgi:hypothetical protein